MRPLLGALGVLAAAVGLTIGVVLAAPLLTAGPGDRPTVTLPGPAIPTDSGGSPGALAAASPTATPEASPAAIAPSTPAPGPTVAIVPVIDFRATQTATDLAEVKAVLAGTSKRYTALELVDDEADAVLAAIGVARPSEADRLVLAPTADDVATDMAGTPRRLGFMRADTVGPGVRALAWAGVELFGNDRVRHLADWPLAATMPPGTRADAFDASSTWTLFAGGDILLDRGVYKTVVVEGKGRDFPFDGGTADITSRYCCSSFGWELPRAKRTGHAGAMRDLIEGADLAIANFENPAPDRFRWHTRGTVFSADPALIGGLTDAGIDYVSLANNHSRDAGGPGLLQTIANLREAGLAVSGAGKDLAAARKPALLEAGDQTVAVLAYDAIAASYHASSDRIGSAPLTASIVRADVKAARAAGADVVIVFPHWGTEYRDRPFAAQQKLARSIIDSGADLVIGNHAHWAAAMEVYKGKPIWYALGNFVFDQTWSEPTLEGITLELTFRGADLVQVRMRPHLILDRSQPNFLDPAGDGRVVLGQVFSASKGLLPW